MTPEEIKDVEKMIAYAMANSYVKKVGDTPIDDLQLTPRKYVNLNGTRANRPTAPTPGQQYFSTQDNYPWFTDGISSWFSATGSIVSGL